MENQYARRNFLKNVALASSGVAFLSSTSILSAFNGNNSPFEGYNPYAEQKTDLRTSTLFGKHVTVKGKIFDKTNLKENASATVEVWHLSPNSKNYKHQAKMKVDANGNYNFITDYPNREEGKYSKIYFKVTSNDKIYFTELNICSNNAYINDKHFKDNIVLENNLFPTHKTSDNLTTINFNIAI